MNRLLPLPLFALLFLALALGSCDGEARHVAKAQAAFARGRFEEVSGELQGLTGPAAVKLRASAADARGRREAGLAEIERIVNLAPGPPMAELERLLLQGPGRIKDALVAESIDSARSSLFDEYAEARARGMRWDDAGVDAPSAGAGQYIPLAQGLEPFDQAVATNSPQASGKPAVEPESSAAALVAAVVTPKEARPREHGAKTEGPIKSPSDAEPVTWRTQLAALSELEDIVTWSLDREDVGELEAAQAGLAHALAFVAETEAINLSSELVFGQSPEHLQREGVRVEDRMLLRREVSRAILAKHSSYEVIGIAGVSAEGIRYDGVRSTVAWANLAAEDWRALASKVTLTSGARLGLAMEYLAHGREDWGDEILSRNLKFGRSSGQQIDQIVAWHRNEDIPSGGYAYRNELWVEARAVQGAAAIQDANKLASRLGKAKGEDRDKLFRKLVELGREDLCREALSIRWQTALKGYGTSGMKREVKNLVESRHEVDRLRSVILERVEDTYAYPLDLSQPGAQGRKQESQSIIDKATRELRDTLKSARPVMLRPSMRGHVEEVRWLAASEVELNIKRTLRPPGLPPWVLAVDPEQRFIRIERFAWNQAELDAMAQDRAVLKRNAALFQENPRKPRETASLPAEVRQVHVTNAYRQLLGRSVLAWDVRIQAAAWDHSDYLSRTGDFGHSEPTPGRETPSARLARRGYTRPGGENCTEDISGADAAHQAWLHSPGHHRNIVAASHTQIASSNVSNYWTQVFGIDTEFLQELEAWSD